MSSLERDSLHGTGRDDSSVPLADLEAEQAEMRAVAQAILDCPHDAHLPPEIMQRAFSALTKTYAVRYQMGERIAPFDAPRSMPPTVVMILASQMLRAIKIEIFELGMFQMWSQA